MEEIYTGIIDKIIGNETKGVDHYNHNGSTWLIFTDEKKWVIEFTKEGTLWYNYNFFQNCFKLMSLDVVENQHYITKWVEDTIINGVNYTGSNTRDESHQVEDTIQNGVKHTEYGDWLDGDERFDDIIQNGVKETKTPGEDGDIMGALDFLSDKNTNNLSHLINDVIEKGIKQTEGIKETWGYEKQPQKRIDDVIMNGQKD
jgi:hypothetical protein